MVFILCLSLFVQFRRMNAEQSITRKWNDTMPIAKPYRIHLFSLHHCVDRAQIESDLHQTKDWTEYKRLDNNDFFFMGHYVCVQQMYEVRVQTHAHFLLAFYSPIHSFMSLNLIINNDVAKIYKSFRETSLRQYGGAAVCSIEKW